MNDLSISMSRNIQKENFLRKIFHKWISPVNSREQLSEIVQLAGKKGLIGHESQIMVEGVMKISQMHVAEIMIAAPKMDLINIDMPVEEMMQKIIDIGHSLYSKIMRWQNQFKK